MSNFTFQPTPEPPSYHDTSNSNYYEGNIQLMEARYLELCSSIRALYRSINEIREFITNDNNDNDKDGDDNKKNDDDNCNNDFLEAINENIILFNKQRLELYNIVNGMNNLNTKIMDVPDDIYIMVVEDHNDATTTAISVTAAIAAVTIDTTTTTTAATTTNTTNTREDDNDDNSNQGFHL